MTLRRRAVAGVAATALAACSPTLDWRELRPEGSGIATMFPCKPDRHARKVALGGDQPRMEMLVCAAGGMTFALAFADVRDPSVVAAALGDLRRLSIANVSGADVRPQPVQVPGMTPNAQSGRIAMDGTLPDGAKIREQAAFFTKGLRVYQASIVGGRVSDEAADNFFGGLKLSE